MLNQFNRYVRGQEANDDDDTKSLTGPAEAVLGPRGFNPPASPPVPAKAGPIAAVMKLHVPRPEPLKSSCFMLPCLAAVSSATQASSRAKS